MTEVELSVTEYAVLGILAEEPSHGFALAKHLDTESEVGRVFTVRRPLVYRALDRLVEVGLAVPVATEQDGGPKRVVHRVTPAGRRVLRRWLATPVTHVRDLRIELLLKLSLLRRAGRSPGPLAREQMTVLAPTVRAIEEPGMDSLDHVELWRSHNAAAAMAFLEEVASRHDTT